GFIGQAVRGIATADIAVHAGKPDLFELALPTVGAQPQVRREWRSPLVDGDGMEGILHMRIQGDVVILVRAAIDYPPEEPGRAQRTHRIPHADHADRRTLALRLDVVKTAPPLLGVGLDVVFVARKHIRHVVVVALVEQADEVHESGQGARGECTAGKSDRKSTRLNSSHVKISYAVFCLKKKKKEC